jgi:disulfide bond formation protein DsbB
MYPAAVVLVAAAALSNRTLGLIGAGLAAIGLPVSIFHRVEQAVGGFGDFCDPNNPCAGKWVEEFGVLTIPTMAGIGFAGIIFFVCLSRRSGAIASTAKTAELV